MLIEACIEVLAPSGKQASKKAHPQNPSQSVSHLNISLFSFLSFSLQGNNTAGIARRK
jgi:hypothetical protein